MGIQQDSTPAIHYLKKAYDSCDEQSIVHYSHRVWDTHEISKADENVCT
jgi:hypothetical protein